ncbi:hypothetical protein K458DRAFT_125648 [Lentithecium fluviatile CBS 122367]|uniref:Uncharacterized protein n=1 Tax=Lentithecium fluviatile CBS 122367 TaxID=1168545 RepID=A0A6G1JFC3_9PLEO|nr:hypothetical protein K458DRAFT_125648 [Lentithecium fluviatile CBS 122367]
MPFLDYVSLFLSLLVAALLCCMLVALGRFSASLRFNAPKASSRLPSGLRAAPIGTTTTPVPPRGTSRVGYLSTQPISTPTMFKQAVKNHNAATPSQVPAASKQQSLAGSFNRPSSAAPKSSTTRPLSTLSGNVTKHNASEARRVSGETRGLKRTSSGLAKALTSQEDAFDYPPLNLSDYENELPPSFHNAMGGKPAPQSPVFFDENDFDSDIDLDVEDPATKTTVTYPTLPSVATGPSRDSGYNSTTPQPGQANKELNSSAPIPWSSSPPEHFEPLATTQKPPQPTKRRHLPWMQNSSQPAMKEEVIPESSRLKKRKQADSTFTATPVKTESKAETYPWNTTQSAIKQQQKNLREANKAVKVNEGNDGDVKDAIKKKKKNTVHRIFLSEEQQHVLNLVVEYKKSVFFTGSAGKCLALQSFVPI